MYSARPTPGVRPNGGSFSGRTSNSGSAYGKAVGKPPLPPMSRLLVGTLSTFVWMLASSALIILNKRIYMHGFHFPFFVTGMGQLCSALAGGFLVRLGLLSLRPLPAAHFCWTRLLPITVSSAATMFFGNAAYLYLSVAFIQILKAFTPALTLLLCVLVGLERAWWPLAASVLLIAFGTAASVLVESGTPSFNLIGLGCFLASSASEAARVVGAEVLLGSQKYNTAEALVYIGGPTAALLLLGSALWEGPGLMAFGMKTMMQHPTGFASAFLMSSLVNMACFFAIQNTSSLTFKVAGCIKNVGVVAYGMVAHKEHVSAMQMGGYAVSIIGFAMYSRLKMMQGGRQKAATGSRLLPAAKKAL